MKTLSMPRFNPLVPLSGGAGLLEKRETLVSTLALAQDVIHTGDWQHSADDVLLLDDEAGSHVNHADDPGGSTLTLTDDAAFNMERLRGLTDALALDDFVHVALDGVAAPPPSIFYMTANETINVGQPVYVSAADTVNLADADTLNTSHVLGLAVTDATANATVTVHTDGKVERSDWTAIAGTANLVAGAVYYLSTAAGQLTITPPTGDGDHVVRCGVAINTTTIDIEINEVAIL